MSGCLKWSFGLFLATVSLVAMEEARSCLADAPATSFRIVGYLPEYRFKTFKPEHASKLTDLILFAAEPTADGHVDLGKVANAPWDLLKEFKAKHGVRLILCMGGWGKSDHFSKAVLNDSARERLVQEIVKVLQQHQMDGLDLDWEHPANAEEMQGYAQLLVDLKKAFQPHGFVLSVTIAPWKEIPAAGFAAADWIQLMSYDYGQRHSTYEQATADVQTFIAKGIPPEKLILGVPFYGRDVKDRRKTITYKDAIKRFQPGEDVDEIEGYFFNGPKTIRHKTRMAIDSKIGGVMVWEIGQDSQTEHSLIKAIHAESTRRSWTTPVRRIPRTFPPRE
ncbi:glycoside hydrolase family 18 protein [Planctomicrobium sp. SH527]|uniref:glycoside hydrolase family 18 protein n=1 Tax=Planctomicrobium sp. SH527 TaxID=3448123 RepID=UPI003F5C4EAE